MLTKINHLMLCSLTIASFSGCVYTSVPDCPKEPALAMPPAIPETVHLIIENGHATADVGGEQLVRDYVATRKAIKARWPD